MFCANDSSDTLHQKGGLTTLVLTICAAVGANVGVSLRASASDGVWNVNASGWWSVPTNWAGGVPSQPGDVATFGPVITQIRFITVDGPFAVGGIVLDANNPYHINPSGVGALTLSAPAGDAFIDVKNAAAGIDGHRVAAPLEFSSNVLLTNRSGGLLTIASRVSGAGDLEKGGPGLVVLDADNSSWSGDLLVSAGTLKLGYTMPGPDAGPYKGLGSGHIVVRNGGTLDLGLAGRNGSFSGSIVNDMTLSGAGHDGAGALR